MYIELLILTLLAIVLLGWAVWYRITNWTIKRRYNENDDKGRKAEEFRAEQLRADISRESSPKNADSNLPGEGEPEGRQLLPPTVVDSIPEPSRNDGETSKGNGKLGKIFRNPFRRRN